MVLWIAGPVAPQVDKLSEEEVLEGSLNLLQKFTGNSDIPRPLAIYRYVKQLMHEEIFAIPED